MRATGNQRSAARSIDSDYETVEIGAVFGKLTLKGKTGAHWLMICACGREKSIRRSIIAHGNRGTCGECVIRKRPERVAKEEAQPIRTGFEIVETRKMPDCTVWNIYRSVNQYAESPGASGDNKEG